ncbi:NAD(P)H-dependent oxidoreductase [Bacillus sp. CMF21]|uniref:NAD(P)H-dependent oxidoreductase n=1 Tax=Metabacillus dongyingensis TaxID=2874282 RepID=UPI001CC17F31|nr:NAD(P)H-dependent oxidoreductase [Metabacillus dongyingensis]UOK58567.1 NAD(P)H-dependent oxidoreductase [Bacillus sp. OVS6]USK29285.1 NAD(P)H-dependent oxidoreductase [Bacillus sp. CMF21]
MNILIIYAHPNPESFNAAICDAVEKEFTSKDFQVRKRDLYQMKFNPILTEDDYSSFYQDKVPADIQAEQSELIWANIFVFVFPTWWAGMPAILKGYFDRVFTNGFAFRYSDEGPEGLLKEKQALIFQTTGQPEKSLKPPQLTMAMQASFDVGIMNFCGIETLAHKFIYSVPYVDEETRKIMLNEVKEVVEMIGKQK